MTSDVEAARERHRMIRNGEVRCSRDLHWKLKGARLTTLSKWWQELNLWGWPKEFGDPEERGRSNPRRDALMKEIAAELGYRWICKKLTPPASATTA